MQVMYVCTGNICRSPMAERLLLARLHPGSDVQVISAGTRAVIGHPMDRAAALVTIEHGADPDGHRAQEVTPELLAGSGLVLAATTDHRDTLLRLAPRAMRRTFTMREFVRLADGLPELEPTSGGAELAARIAEVAARRGWVDPPAPGQDDIGDPFGAPLAQMQATGATVSATVDATLRILGLLPAP